MDYISQIEKLYSFFNLSLSIKEKQIVFNIKKKFSNDLNLLGCYIKDFLTIENNGKISQDNKIYNDFIVCFEKYCTKSESYDFLTRVDKLGEYFLDIVFERSSHRVLSNAISTINSLYYIEAYPYLIELIEKYFNQEINGNLFNLMLTFLIDTVIKNYDNPKQEVLDYTKLKLGINKQISNNLNERLAI